MRARVHGISLQEVRGTATPLIALLSIPMAEEQEKRREEQVFTQLPVELGAAMGVTRDVSATGLYIETDAQYPVGGKIDLSVELDTPGGKMILKCHGSIVRLEHHGTKTGVAVKIIDSTIEPAGHA